MSQIKNRISEFNKNRDQEIVALKYKRMSENSSRFFRGSCHLFYEDIIDNIFLNNAPKTWICGDLHLENFGTFTGSDGICYFDINDFDEALLAPMLWDVSRIMTSIVVFGKDLKWSESEITNYLNVFYDTYIMALKKGKSYMLHQKTASGEIAELLEKVEKRKSNYLLKSKTEKKEKFIIEEEKTYKLAKDFKKNFSEILAQKLSQHADFNSYKILDIVGRIAGTGSLGLPRYLVLLHSKEKNDTFILDLKTARASALEKYTKIEQPKWKNQAERICFVQDTLQYNAPDLLESWHLETTDFVVRNYQPSEDKIDWFSIGNKSKNIKNIIIDFAKLLAWSQIRVSGKNGAENMEDIIKFIEKNDSKTELLAFSLAYSKKVVASFEEFIND